MRNCKSCATIFASPSTAFPSRAQIRASSLSALGAKCISLPARWRLDHGAYRFPVELWLNKKLKERTAALKPAVDAKRLEPNTVEATC